MLGCLLLASAAFAQVRPFNVNNLTSANGIIYFTATDSEHGNELWRSNGTAAGTYLVKDINPGSESSNPRQLLNINGTIFFVANYQQYYNADEDGPSPDAGKESGFELWKTDGTEAGTIKVGYFQVATQDYAYEYNTPIRLMNFNGTLVFTAGNSYTGYTLYKSDGTLAGTKSIIQVRSREEAYELANAGKYIYYNSVDPISKAEALWRTDGTPEGTMRLYEPYILQGSSGFLREFFNVNGSLFYSAATTNGHELWKSNGTPEGTVLVKDIIPGPESSYPILLGTSANVLYFTPGISRNALWKSDGTEQGTVVVKNNITPSSSVITGPGGQVYFSAKDATHGSELWKSDGTEQGTMLVKDINPGVAASDIGGLVYMNGVLYFYANHGGNEFDGRALWKSDGTSAGTVLIKYITPTNKVYAIRDLTVVQNTLFFIGQTTYSNSSLWKSDGTEAGTVNVFDVVAPVACSATGSILREYWANVAGFDVSAIPVNTTPTSTSQLTSFEAPTNAGNNYGQRIRGYICVPKNGTYTFYIAGDDNAELYLSTDENPVNKTKIAYLTGANRWTAAQQWTKFTTQKSAAISLVAGKKYYIEALHKEGLYSDHLVVGWQSSPTAAITVIPGSILSPFVIQNTGKISREYWANVTGALVSEIPLNTTPTSVSEITSFETATNAGNNYGQRIRGYVHPQVSGNYRFFIAGDDRCELWLSTDEDPAKKVKIASVPYFAGVREWNKYSTQQSAAITLQVGKKYYIEALHKEGLYSDNLAVGWTMPGQSTVSVIAGSYLSPFLSSPTSSIARVGVEESFAGKVNLYPNPFEDKLTLSSSQSGKHYISVVDNLGRVVYQTSTEVTQAETTLGLAHLKTGVYMVKVAAENGTTQVLKVVKK